MGKGIFISFEGIDGCGKSTQMELAGQHLRSKGYDVVTTREPGGTKIAEMIRNILLDPSLRGHIAPTTELLLYLASRVQHCDEIIIPQLENGKIVLSDRFADSSIAYQGAGRGLGMEFVEELNNKVVPRFPDLTILIDLPVELAIERFGDKALDRLEGEGIEFLRRIRNGYLDFSLKRSERIKVVHSDGEIEETSRKVITIIDEFLDNREK